MIKANVISGHSNWKRFLIKPNDYLKKRLNKLSKSKILRQKLGNSAFNRQRSIFSRNSMLKKYMQIYKDQISRK